MEQDWDAVYREGRLDHLRRIKEVARFGAVAGWLHHLLPRFRVLDLGCGEGLFLPFLDPARLASYVGLDIAPTAVARARDLVENGYVQGRVVCESIERFLPEASERFDAIVFNEVLFFVEDPVAQLARYRAWLAPGGVVVVSQYRSPKAEGGARRITSAIFEALEAPPWHVLDRLTLTSTHRRDVTWDLRLVTV
jgi:2-polyprenyl-3-methyl-5-hydroxy-6-metoxy-1,4-benzoquinol methylase